MKLNKILSAILAAAVAVSSMTLSAFAAGDQTTIDAFNAATKSTAFVASPAAAQNDSGYTYTVSGSEATITGYTGAETDLVIPSSIDSYTVTAIANSAFSGNTSITSVTIPEGVTSIGFKAFYKCTSIKSVTIPSTVTSWNDDASKSYNGDNFYGCTALTDLTLTEGLTILGQRAFYGCTALTSVVIPSTISEFHNCVFGECTSLTDITLSEGMTTVGYRAFYGCTALKKVTVPSTITLWSTLRANGIMATVHECNPFNDCTALESVIFTDGLTTLYNFYGFKGCSSLKEVTIPDSVTDISYGFNGSDYLEKVTLGSGLSSVSHSAFIDCTALKEVVIPDTVTNFDYYAFQDCSSLEILVLPKNFSYIQGSSLRRCSGLKTVLFLSNSAQYNSEFVATPDTTIYAILGTNTYSNFKTNMTDAGTVSQLVGLPKAEITASAYLGAYDGEAHEAVEVSGVVDGIKIMYSLNGADLTSEIPTVADYGKYTIDVYKVYEAVPTEIPIYVTTVEAVVSVDKSALETAIADAEKINASLYTADSYAVLEAAITAAKTVFENVDATSAEVDNAVKSVTDAIAALELKIVTGNVSGKINVSDGDTETEMTVKAVASDGTKTSVTATSMGTYTLENLPVGDYTLTISGGKYVERTYKITVEAGELTQDVELNPHGDINGDGKVTTADVGMANSHAKGVKVLEGYKFDCADVKTDGDVTTADVGMINSHAKSVKTLW